MSMQKLRVSFGNIGYSGMVPLVGSDVSTNLSFKINFEKETFPNLSYNAI